MQRSANDKGVQGGTDWGMLVRQAITISFLSHFYLKHTLSSSQYFPFRSLISEGVVKAFRGAEELQEVSSYAARTNDGARV